MLFLLALLASAPISDFELSTLVEKSAASFGPIVLVGAPGKEAESDLRDLLGSNPHVRIVRVGAIGDPEREIAGALATASLHCGLRAERLGSARWSVSTYGSCGTPPAAAAPTAPAAIPGPAAPTAPAAATGPALPVQSAAPPPAASIPSAPTASSGASTALVEAIILLPDAASRRNRLTEEIANQAADPDRVARLGQALAVLANLEKAGRSDPSVLRAFLRGALADDPAVRVQAVSASGTGGDPPGWGNAAPTTAPAQVASAPPSQPVATMLGSEKQLGLRRYKAERLVRGSLTDVRGSFSSTNGNGSGTITTVHTWTVYDGGGQPFSTRGFAERVGDGVTLDRLERRTTAVGAATAIGGVVAIVGMASYLGNDEKPMAPAVISLAGFAVAVAAPTFEVRRRQFVSGFYTTYEADALTRRYNDKLRERLGLSEEDVRGMDLSLGLSPAGATIAGTF
jgi:hypothetical protein